MFPTLQLGPLNIPSAPLILLISAWIGLTASEKFSVRLKLNADTLYNLVFLAFISGILGARLGFIARFPSAFTNFSDVFSLNAGLLDTISGLASGFIVALVYAQRKRLKLFPTLDALTPFFAIFMVGLGLSQLASGEAFGLETNLPWAIHLWGADRHPTQVYAFLAAFGTMLITARGRAESLQTGMLFAGFSALTAAWMLFVSAFRGDSSLFAAFRAEQISAWFALAISLALLDYLHGLKMDVTSG